jgi:hypothetical protein
MSRLLAESARRLPEHLDLTERAAANWLQLVRSLSADSAADQHPLVHERSPARSPPRSFLTRMSNWTCIGHFI